MISSSRLTPGSILVIILFLLPLPSAMAGNHTGYLRLSSPRFDILYHPGYHDTALEMMQHAEACWHRGIELFGNEPGRSLTFYITGEASAVPRGVVKLVLSQGREEIIFLLRRAIFLHFTESFFRGAPVPSWARELPVCLAQSMEGAGNHTTCVHDILDMPASSNLQEFRNYLLARNKKRKKTGPPSPWNSSHGIKLGDYRISRGSQGIYLQAGSTFIRMCGAYSDETWLPAAMKHVAFTSTGGARLFSACHNGSCSLFRLKPREGARPVGPVLPFARVLLHGVSPGGDRALVSAISGDTNMLYLVTVSKGKMVPLPGVTPGVTTVNWLRGQVYTFIRRKGLLSLVTMNLKGDQRQELFTWYNRPISINVNQQGELYITAWHQGNIWMFILSSDHNVLSVTGKPLAGEYYLTGFSGKNPVGIDLASGNAIRLENYQVSPVGAEFLKISTSPGVATGELLCREPRKGLLYTSSFIETYGDSRGTVIAGSGAVFQDLTDMHRLSFNGYYVFHHPDNGALGSISYTYRKMGHHLRASLNYNASTLGPGDLSLSPDEQSVNLHTLAAHIFYGYTWLDVITLEAGFSNRLFIDQQGLSWIGDQENPLRDWLSFSVKASLDTGKAVGGDWLSGALVKVQYLQGIPFTHEMVNISSLQFSLEKFFAVHNSIDVYVKTGGGFLLQGDTSEISFYPARSSLALPGFSLHDDLDMVVMGRLGINWHFLELNRQGYYRYGKWLKLTAGISTGISGAGHGEGLDFMFWDWTLSFSLQLAPGFSFRLDGHIAIEQSLNVIPGISGSATFTF